jgi:hypothetical protein
MGSSDADDEGDYFFDNADNRALLESLVAEATSHVRLGEQS